MKKKELLFVFPKKFTFIDTEIKLLDTKFNIDYLQQNWQNKCLVITNLLIQFVHTILKIKKTDIILISFAGYWSLIPSIIGNLFNKKVAIVVHGTDCVDFPEIKYGSLRKPILKWFISKSLKLCDIILPVSDSLILTENRYYDEKIRFFGFKHHIKNINTTCKVIHNGLFIEDWKQLKVNKVPNSFITVMTENQFYRKGGDLIIEIAKLLPECKFYFAGHKNLQNQMVPNNIFFLGKLKPVDLKEYYSKCQFYLQISNFEGFGVAICEAMLCGCIPIVSNVNHLPEIAGSNKLILKKRSAQMLKKLIENLFTENLEILKKQSIERVKNNYSARKRQKELTTTLNNL